MRPLNTTLAVIATDAALTKHECARMAISGHDGMARAIDPSTSSSTATSSSRWRPALPSGRPEDNLVVAAYRTSSRPAQLVAVSAAAADVVCRAIVHAAIAATSAGGMISYLDRFPSARRR